jgi:lysophospholipase L1-like esterase
MLKKTLFLLYCIVVPVALLEIFCYFFRPAPLFEAISITSTSELQYQLVENPDLIYIPQVNSGAFNNAGHRGDNYPLKNNSGKKRVAVLGDSVVEGFLLDTQQRFTELLTSETHEFINFGVRGYNLKQYIEYLKLRVLDYHPESIIVGITFNDLRLDSGEIQVLKNTIAKQKRSSFYATYYGAKNSLTQLLMGLNSFRYAFYYMSKPSQAHKFSEAASTNFASTTAASDSLFQELVDICDENEIKLSFIVFPVNPRHKDRSDLEKMISSIENLNLRVVDLEAITVEQFSLTERSSWFLNPHDPCHLNSKGMEIIANILQEKINYLLFINASGSQ